jgi:hypothetical protein
MTSSIEYASLHELEQRVISTNGCDHQAAAELRRRQLSQLTGAGRRDPRALLAEMERRRHPNGAPRDRLIQVYANYRGRDARMCLLALHAARISQDW